MNKPNNFQNNANIGKQNSGMNIHHTGKFAPDDSQIMEASGLFNDPDLDLLPLFLENDSKFVQTRQKYFKQFNQAIKAAASQETTDQNLFTNFMQNMKKTGKELKQRYLNLAYFISKHAIIASLIAILSLSTMAVSAAEVFAEKSYKPTTVVKNVASGKPPFKLATTEESKKLEEINEDLNEQIGPDSGNFPISSLPMIDNNSASSLEQSIFDNFTESCEQLENDPSLVDCYVINKKTGERFLLGIGLSYSQASFLKGLNTNSKIYYGIKVENASSTKYRIFSFDVNTGKIASVQNSITEAGADLPEDVITYLGSEPSSIKFFPASGNSSDENPKQDSGLINPYLNLAGKNLVLHANRGDGVFIAYLKDSYYSADCSFDIRPVSGCGPTYFIAAGVLSTDQTSISYDSNDKSLTGLVVTSANVMGQDTGVYGDTIPYQGRFYDVIELQGNIVYGLEVDPNVDLNQEPPFNDIPPADMPTVESPEGNTFSDDNSNISEDECNITQILPDGSVATTQRNCDVNDSINTSTEAQGLILR